MATRLKTVEFAVPPYTTAITDNTLTTLTQITVYLPETSKIFRSVHAKLSVNITGTAAGNLTTRQLQCRLASAAYVAHTNSNAVTNSGEDIQGFHTVDLTSHFASNFGADTATQTFDTQVLLDSAATTPGATNACVTLSITYEYDDTSTTQIKTVRFPLNAPVGALATTKPGTATDTLPALDTELPEASKVYRSIFTTVQGNAANVANTTDLTITQQWVTSAAHTSGIFEAALATDYWFRYVWNCGVGGSNVLVTNTTQAYYIYSNVARMNHLQVWLTVTYEFDASASNDVFVSLMLPNDFDSPIGGTTSSDYQRTTREFFIQETGVVDKQVAYYPHWSQIGAISTLNFRVGTGSFIAYTDAAASVAGGNGAMVRNDAAFTLARGRNTLNFDAYRSDTSDLGWSFSGFWIVNYTADKPPQGHGAANHTVVWNLGPEFDGAAALYKAVSAIAPIIPDASYYMTALGVRCEINQNGTTLASSFTVLLEKTAAEGGVQWFVGYKDAVHGDIETGLFTVFGQIKDYFKRWPGDPDAGRLDIETARRWMIYNGGVGTGFYNLDLLMTYHAITYTVSGSITGSSGGTVSIDLERVATGETVATTTRTGDGAYSFTWYDDTEQVYVSAREDATHVGRSDNGTGT